MKSRLNLLSALLIMGILFSCSNQSVEKMDVSYYELTGSPEFITNNFGPFGTQDKSYEPPEGAIFVSPDGEDINDGKSIDSPMSIEKAIPNAKTGDVIVLRGGLYRTGNLTFNKKITIQPYKNEKPVIRGSKIADEWVKRGEYWVTKWDSLFPQETPSWYKSEERDGPACNYNHDLVVIDNEMYRPVGSTVELDSGKFYCDYQANEVYVSDNPEGRIVEITYHNQGIIRTHDELADKEGPTILGLDIIHYAASCINIEGDDPYRFISPGEMPDAPVKTHIQNCRMHYCADDGLRITSPDSYVAYNDISMIGNVGVITRMSHNNVFEHNIVSNSNWFKLRIYPAGIKVFNQCYNYTIRNNFFADMPCEAIWYDVGHREGIVVNNYFYNCGIGLKVEICHRTYIAGNVFEKANLWLCNSNGCMVYNNTMIDSRIDLWRNNRGAGNWNRNYSFNHAGTGPGPKGYHGHHVANNVFTGKPRGDFYALIEDNNHHDTCFHAEVYTQNAFLTQAKWTFNIQVQPLGLVQPQPYETLKEVEDLLGEYINGNAQLALTPENIFQNPETGDYRMKDVDGLPEGIAVPKEIAKLLGWDNEKKGMGAFAQ